LKEGQDGQLFNEPVVLDHSSGPASISAGPPGPRPSRLWRGERDERFGLQKRWEGFGLPEEAVEAARPLAAQHQRRPHLGTAPRVQYQMDLRDYKHHMAFKANGEHNTVLTAQRRPRAIATHWA
jgi:hypothetical protein